MSVKRIETELLDRLHYGKESSIILEKHPCFQGSPVEGPSTPVPQKIVSKIDVEKSMYHQLFQSRSARLMAVRIAIPASKLDIPPMGTIR